MLLIIQAMHIQPSDRAILYNIAMIQQKSAELLFSLELSKRTSEEVQIAIGQAQQAVKSVYTAICIFCKLLEADMA